MKNVKKLLAYVLCITMLAGMFQMPVSAAEVVEPVAQASEVVDAALFFSDLHTSQYDYKDTLIKSVMGGVKTSGLKFSSVTSVGDAFSSNTIAYPGDTSKITKSIRDGLGDSTVPVFYAWSDHDRGADIAKYTGLLYGDIELDEENYMYDSDANYYIYTISMSDMTGSVRYGEGSTFTEQKLQDFEDTIAMLDHSKPLFIASHQPLHDRRDDNQHAKDWYGVISDAAEQMDIAFFWGHNHTSETSADTNGFYVEKDGTEKMTIDGIGSITPNFTYLNAGYLSNSGSQYASDRENVVTAVAIYEDKVNYTLYDKDGVYDSEQAFSLNVDVPREFKGAGNTETPDPTPEEPENGIPTDAVLSSLEITSLPAATKYFVDAEGQLDLAGMIVEATYSNSETSVTKELAADDYALAYDLSVVGTQEVVLTYTYGDVTLTDTFEITVSSPSYSSEDLGVDVEIAFENPEVTDVKVEVNTDAEIIKTAVEGLLENYVSYEFDLTGYTEGNVVTLTLPLPEGVTKPAVYHVSDSGVATRVQNVTVNEDGTVTFDANAFSSYVVGNDTNEATLEFNPTVVTVPDVYAGEPRTVYILTSNISAGNSYLIANSNSTTGGNKYVLANNGGNIAATAVTVKSGNVDGESGNETYIDSADFTNELWKVSGSYAFENAGVYLGYITEEGTLSWATSELALEGTARTWSYSTNNNRLSISAPDGWSNSTHYLRYNSGWTLSTSNASVYFYVPTQLTEIETYGATYSIAGTSETISKEVLPGAEATLGSTLTIDSNNPSIGITTEDVTANATYTKVEGGDPAGVISKIEGNKVTFSGVAGTALVRVSYTGDSRFEGTVDNYILIEAKEPTADVKIDITHDHDNNAATDYESVEKTIVIKWVTNETTYDLDCKGILGTGDNATEFAPVVTWTTNKEKLATVDENGLVTFEQDNGTVQITATYTYGNGKVVTDVVTFSISVGEYIVPGDGTDAFPEYPNEGSIRFDKTATSVGTFSETGIAQLELSMTGIPYTSGNRMDVVLMLDRSSSMYKSGVQHRISSTVEATKLFIKNIVVNEDGSFNNNRIMVMDFLGGNLDSSEGGGSRHKYQSNLYTKNEENGYQVISNQTELDDLLQKIEDDFKGQTSLYGTEYAQGLESCYNALHASKEDGNKQFCVFMSDGIPNYMMGETTHFKKTDDIVATFDVTNYRNASAAATRNATKYEYEYYSTQMKNEGVTVFTVGLGLKNTNSAWSNASKEACEQVANMLLNDISGPAGEKPGDRDKTNAVSKLNKYFFSVADDNAAENMKNVFSGIAQSILEAAKDVRVTDKIADKYTMVFEAPNAEVASKLPAGQSFYIEAKEYDLNAVDENKDGVIDDYTREENPDSLLKVYLGMKDDEYFAATDAAGTTPHDAPVFEAKAVGKKYYWSTDSKKADAKVPVTVPVTNAQGEIVAQYYFVPSGDGEFNIVSGAYAYGTLSSTNIVNDEDNTLIGTNETSQDLVIATEYFVYDAGTRMLVWTTEKLTTKELTLTYFLYLENSGGFVGNVGATADGERLPVTEEGSYDTNDYAHLDYTNFQGVECEQTFPVPQLTWNGAQVSYVFYLVNDQGIPVNRAGRPIPFSEAVYVTDTYTYAVTWNAADMSGKLEAEYLAKNLVPDVYELYDHNAKYNINVYETEDGENKNNHFVISGTEGVRTTYVFNTKADTVKYTEHGSYDAGDVRDSFDFANTTVAFAVRWSATLVEDVVVIDYGLPVDINVLANDNIDGKVIGLNKVNNGRFEGVDVNSGLLPPRGTYTQVLQKDATWGLKYGEAKVMSDSTIRYTPKTMNISDSDMFHYVAELRYYDDQGTYQNANLYSNVTVVPATNIYFEDTTTFVTYTDGKSGGAEADENYTLGKWTVAGTENTSATQDVDRPGPSKISATLDKDNVYGYDSAYVTSDTYSLGSAHKVTVSAAQNPSGRAQEEKANYAWPTASFTFTGTAFDIISLTSSQTGVITVKVENADKSYSKNWIVDTYYGYTYVANSENPYVKNTFEYGTDGKWHLTDSVEVENMNLLEGESTEMPTNPKVKDRFVTFEKNGEWIATDDAENALYQIPVIKSPELTYGTYNVTITARYSSSTNHSPVEGDDSYDFYLDGVRVYGPAQETTALQEVVNGVAQAGDKTIGDVYRQDGEGTPVVLEIRKNLLGQNAFVDASAGSVNGVVFIDGLGANGTILDYQTYGPNNEVYLEPNHAIAFRITDTAAANYVAAHLGVKAPNGDAAKVSVTNGTASVEVATGSATEMYYDITDAVQFTGTTSNVIVIANTGDALISLTNVKVTHAPTNVAPAVEFKVTKSDAAYAANLVYDQYVANTPVETPTIVPIKKAVTEVFADVKNGWYTDSVQFVYNKGIMSGSNGNFRPNEAMTRAMLVTTLYRMSGSPEVTDRSACEVFPDVAENNYYTDAICWAYNEGIVTGYGDRDTFGVADYVTREQLSVILYRYAEKNSLDVTQRAELSGLKNNDKVHNYAKEAVSWMNGTGMIGGVPKLENGKTVYDLAPNQSATRAEMAKILTRFCELYNM